MADMFLSLSELAVLTGRTVKSKQVKTLRNMGVPFFVNACGRPIVARAAIEGRVNVAGHTERPSRMGWSPGVLGD